jgi:hypothetical protein
VSAQNDTTANKGQLERALESMASTGLEPSYKRTSVPDAPSGGVEKPLSVWDRLRLRLKKNANRVVSLKALTNEFGELVGFVVDDAQVIEGGKAG